MFTNNTLELLAKLNLSKIASNTFTYSFRGMDIHLEGDKDGSGLYFFYSLGLCPAKPSAEFVKNILSINLLGLATKGGNLGLYEEQNILIYSLRMETKNINEHKLQNALVLFANTAIELSKKIKGITNNTDPKSMEKKAQDLRLQIKGLRA